MIGRKGLFGKVKMPGAISGYGGGTFDMDGTQVTPAYSMPQNATMQDSANLGAPAPMGGERPGLGTRLFGKGWEDKAMAIGGMLMGNQFAIPQYLRQQGEMQQQAALLAERQRQQAMQMSAAQSMGIDQQQAALLGPEGLRQITVDRLKPAEGPKPGSFEWFQTATQEQRALYDQYNPVIATTWQGPTPVPRSSLGGVPSKPVGKLTPITPGNTPAPQLGANGMPTSLTRAQYQAVVNSMGQAETEAWARRNNIRVVD